MEDLDIPMLFSITLSRSIPLFGDSFLNCSANIFY